MLEYKIDVSINAKKGEFESICEISFDDKQEMIEFLVHQSIIIRSIEAGEENLKYVITDFDELQFMPESKKITVFGKDIHNFTINYEGRLAELKNKVNSLKEDTVELNIYSSWYPVQLNLPEANYNISITGLEEFEVIHGTKNGKSWKLNIKSSNDAYIIAFKNCIIKRINNENVNIDIYSNNLKGKEIIDIIATQLEDIYNFYVKLFGNINQTFELIFAIMNRVIGGGYFRKNLIVIPINDRTEEEWIHFLAHELAHRWWTGASTITWEDWLNESIAEFSSWLYIEHKLGDTVYKDIISEYENEVKQCPPIRNLERGNEYVYYSRFKGAQILSKLRKKFGNEYLINVLKLLLNLPERNTDDWIKEITKLGYNDISQWLLVEIEK